MGVGGGVGLHGLSRLEEGTKAWTAAPQASGGLIGVCLGGGRMRQQGTQGGGAGQTAWAA